MAKGRKLLAGWDLSADATIIQFRIRKTGSWAVMKHIFISGCPRSGTTALMELLNKDLRIAIAKERFKHQPRVCAASFEPEYFLTPKAEETNLLDESFYASLSERVRSGNLSYIGDKVPGYFRRLDALCREFKEAKFFMLLRDPVSVACSFNRRSQRPSAGWSSEKDYNDAIRQWNDSLWRAYSFHGRRGFQSLFVVKYEWLFCGDERYLEAIYAYLGLDLQESVRKQFRLLTEQWPKRQRKKLSLSKEQVLKVTSEVDLELAAWAKRTVIQQFAAYSYSSDAEMSPSQACGAAWLEQRDLMLSMLSEDRSANPAEKDARAKKTHQGATRVRSGLEKLFQEVTCIESSRSWGLLTFARRVRAAFSRKAALSRNHVSVRVGKMLERARLHETTINKSERLEMSPGPKENRLCPICKKESPAFLPFGKKRRLNAKCPHCFSLERHRLLWFYLEKETNILLGEQPLRLCHIAPEKALEERLRSVQALDYLSGDLDPGKATIQLDLTNLEFPSASFDVIICSHVLEHIPDDQAAMREMLRVLKIGGIALVQTPVRRGPTLEDPSITSPAKRRQVFGQEDHVRVYGVDIADRLNSVGFEAKLCFAEQIASPRERRLMALGNRTLVVCRKEK